MSSLRFPMIVEASDMPVFTEWHDYRHGGTRRQLAIPSTRDR